MKKNIYSGFERKAKKRNYFGIYYVYKSDY